MGLLGDGVGASGCKSTGWAVRVVYERLHRRHLRWLEDPVAKAAITEVASPPVILREGWAMCP
eukprot:2875222-Rhodomonas_salina.2